MIHKGKERRKKILIERKMQLRHTGLLAISFLFILVLVQIQVYALISSMMPRIALTSDYTYITGLGLLIGAEMLVVILVVGFINVLLTHRLVGPLIRITRELNEMSQKDDYHHLRIRKRDEIHSVVAEINKIIDRIKKQ